MKGDKADAILRDQCVKALFKRRATLPMYLQIVRFEHLKRCLDGRVRFAGAWRAEQNLIKRHIAHGHFTP